MLDSHYFNFFYIPGHVASRNYSRQDYEEIILKFLLKVKLRYMARKAESLPDKPLEKITITEDDMTPFEVLDDVISEIKNKNQENLNTIIKYIKECKEQVATIVAKMQDMNEKTRRVVEYNVLIDHLNKTMEKKNEENFKNSFIHRNLYIVFIR